MYNSETNEFSGFCSVGCRELAKVKRLATTIKRVSVVEHKHIGSYSELIAAAWLLERGYEVFRNVSMCGPIDIVAIKGRETLLIDVKTVRPTMLISRQKLGQARLASKPQLKPPQREKGVIALYVGPDGFCSFNMERIREVYNKIYELHLNDSSARSVQAASKL